MDTGHRWLAFWEFAYVFEMVLQIPKKQIDVFEIATKNYKVTTNWTPLVIFKTNLPTILR